MIEPAPPPLPARPDLRPGEDIAALLARTASANHTTVRELTGLQAGDTVVTEGAFLLKSDVLREKMGAGCAD